MKGKVKKIFEILLPLGLSCVLILWLFKKVNFHEVAHLLSNGVDYGWLLLVMVIVTLSHIIRGIRWGYQLRAAGVGNLSKMELSCSIFGAYSMNLLVPYMGEAWRIVYIAKRQHAPVSTVLGTDFGDRISDAIVVVLLLLLALIVGHQYIYAFMDRYSAGEKLHHILIAPMFWVSFGLSVGIIIIFMVAFRRKKWMNGVNSFLLKVWNGFKVLFTMKGRWQYLFLTIGIWTCYYLETYIGFMSFPVTRHLMEQPGMAWGLLPGLISFVFSSMSIAIPSNGGLGPWNLAVMFALSLFGVANADGAAFSILLWSTTTLTLILLGLFTVGYVMYSRAKEERMNKNVKNIAQN